MVPRTAPQTAMTMMENMGTWASGLIIQSPGIVKAIPPATMAPALISVCVTLISCSVLFLTRPRTDMDRTVTKTVGHGSAPILSATYIELTVIMSRPAIPVRAPLSVSCLPLFSSMIFISLLVMIHKKRILAYFAHPLIGGTIQAVQ